jgi:hypothetical protein
MNASEGRGWEHFWGVEAPTFNLGLYRILLGCVLWVEVATTRARSLFAIEGGFHQPYVSWLQPVSPQVFEWLIAAQRPCIILLVLGLAVRPSIVALLGLQGYVFFADYLNFRNHPYFFLLVLLLLLLSPCGDALSLRALWRGAGGLRQRLLGSIRPLAMQRLIQLQYSLVYFYSALHKLHPTYLRGEVLAMHLGPQVTSGSSGRLLRGILEPDALARLQSLAQDPRTMIVPAVLTVVLELFLPFGLWFRRTRGIAMLCGVLFHLGIALTMGIYAFSVAMLAGYLLFLEPDALTRRWTRLRSRRHSR